MSRGTETPILAEISVGQQLPLVDRVEELTLLGSLFQQTIAGRGQVVSVAGEAGVGKTRLVYELGNNARKQGAIFAVGPSYEEEAIIPYSPWIEAIRSLFREVPVQLITKTMSRTVSEVARIVPEVSPQTHELGIKGWVSGLERADLIYGTDVDRTRLFQAVTDLLTHISTERPIILFLDDILWADAASIQLLHYFCRRVRERKIMVVVAYRDVELPKQHPLSRLLLDLNRERILREITLSRLTPDFVAEIISNHLGGEPVAPEFAKLIHARSGGNPFFVEEVLRHLVEESRLYKSERGWTLKEISEVEIPSTVRALIEHRVSRLDENMVQTLFAASVIGMNFSFELLHILIGSEEEDLISQVEQAVRSGMLTESSVGGEVSYVFPDEQIRDYFYNALSLIRRRKIHSRIARAIEEYYKSELDQHLDELAYHYIQASELTKAAEFSLKAGDRALKLHAHPEAKRHYQNVLELLEGGQLNDRLDVLTKLGDASSLMGESRDGVRYYTEAVDLATRLKENRRQVLLFAELGYVAWNLESDKQSALAYFKQGLKALESGEESPEKAAILQSMGRLLIITGEVEEGRPLCEEALKIAKELNVFSVQVHAIQSLALAMKHDKQHKGEIPRYCEEALKMALDHGLEEPACRAFHNLACQYAFIKGDYARTGEILSRGVEFAKKTVNLIWEALMKAEQALYVYLPLGDWDKALETANQSLHISSEYTIKVALSKSYMALGFISICRGDLGKAEECLTAAQPLVEKIRITEWTYLCHYLLGRLYIEKKEYAKAENNLNSAAEIGQHAAYISTHDSLFELIRLYLKTGNAINAEEAYETLRRAAEDLDEAWAYAYEQWARGLITAFRGDLVQAIEAYTKSSELWKKLGHRYHYARTVLELGGVLPRTADSKSGGEQFEEARTIFTQLGAKLDLLRAETNV